VLGSLFNDINNMSLFYPCEFTAEYIGIPPVFPNEQPNKTVGGGLVDTQVSGGRPWGRVNPTMGNQRTRMPCWDPLCPQEGHSTSTAA